MLRIFQFFDLLLLSLRIYITLSKQKTSHAKVLIDNLLTIMKK